MKKLLTVRVESTMMEALKKIHRDTYPQHGQSFNAWMVENLSIIIESI